jgi:hypothetical protein
MKAIVVAIEVTQNGDLTNKAPSTSFYVIPQTWENVPDTVERLTKEFAADAEDTWAGTDRRDIAQAVKNRGNKLIFKPFIFG